MNVYVCVCAVCVIHSINCVAFRQYAGNFYLKTICVLYLAFVYYDRHTGDRGGRGAG